MKNCFTYRDLFTHGTNSQKYIKTKKFHGNYQNNASKFTVLVENDKIMRSRNSRNNICLSYHFLMRKKIHVKFEKLFRFRENQGNGRYISRKIK